MDPKLLELLVCPVTKGYLDYDRERQELLSRSARGMAGIELGVPLSADQVFRIGSVNKQFATATRLKLIDERHPAAGLARAVIKRRS